MTPGKRFAVGYCSFFDGVLELTEITADSELEAARKFLLVRWEENGPEALADVRAFTSYEELVSFVGECDQVIKALELGDPR